mmetsp:Transcript_33005/g.29257  ORF Transcript_33005/g.29257 Transcript_33005/m.29257 type:complete len:181 (+) Transcript_33005:85-627(+)
MTPAEYLNSRSSSKISNNSQFSKLKIRNMNTSLIKNYDMCGNLKMEGSRQNIIKEETIGTKAFFNTRKVKRIKTMKLKKSPPVHSFDERIIEIHNISNPKLDIDPRTLDLVRDNFTLKQWVNLEAFKEQYEVLQNQYLKNKKELDLIRAEEENVYISDTTESSGEDNLPPMGELIKSATK